MAANFEHVSLVDDPEHYEKTFSTFMDHKFPPNSREAGVPMVLKHGNIRTCISRLEQSGKSLRVIGIGSGTGVEDCKLINGLLEMYPKIHITVVEPNEDHLRQYQETVASTENLQKADWDWRQQSWDDYLTFRRETNDSSKFHIMTSVYSIHYVQGGLDAAVDRMVDCLKDGGVLLICINRKDNGLGMMSDWPWRNDHSIGLGDQFDSLELKESLERRGLLCEEAVLAEYCDVTDCLERKNESDARDLEDFMTHVVNFKERAPSEVYVEFMKQLQDPKICSREKGRNFIDVSGDVIIAKRE